MCLHSPVSAALPQLADICAGLAVSVGAGVRVGGGGEGGDGGVGIVLAGRGPAGESEDTAHSEGRGTGSWGSSSQGGALRGSVASPIEIVGASAGTVGESNDVEDRQLFVPSSCIFSSSADQVK